MTREANPGHRDRPGRKDRQGRTEKPRRPGAAHPPTATPERPPRPPVAAARPPQRSVVPAAAPRLEPPRPAASQAPWIYGRHAVAAALANPARRIRRIAASYDLSAELAPLLLAARADLPSGAPETMDRHTLESLLPEGAVHQGLAIVADPLPRREIADLVADLPAEGAPHLIVALDQVTDPHNVGAILRSAAAFGALALVVPEHGAAPVTGVLAKAASGALEATPLLRVGNLVRALEQLKAANFWCVGLDAAAEESLATLDLPPRIVLVLGAEGAEHQD